MINTNIVIATIFEELCQIDNSGLSKLSFIHKMPKGYWGVFSHKGRLLGKYKSRAAAEKRLKQIEMFKHMKQASADPDVTYTEMLRRLNKKYPAEIVKEFRTIFKDTFDDALLQGEEDPEAPALEAAMEFIDTLDQGVSKVAGAIEMGDPLYAGKYIASMITFLMRRISMERRSKAMNNLKNKIYAINEFDISRKKMPASSSIGQAISLTKNLLMMHPPQYVRAVLNSIVSNL